MNDHLPGPCVVKRPLVATLHGPRIFAAGNEIADVPAYLLAKKPIADLIAASYTSFDKAGRELGVDAVELARSLDIAEALNLLGDCIPYLCDAMDSGPNETERSKKARALSVRINAIAFPKIDAAFRAHKARQAAK